MALEDILFGNNTSVNLDIALGGAPDPALPEGKSLQEVVSVIDERVKRIDGNTQPQ